MDPLASSSSPRIALSRVVLPAPQGPAMNVSFLDGRFKFKSRRTSTPLLHSRVPFEMLRKLSGMDVDAASKKSSSSQAARYDAKHSDFRSSISERKRKKEDRDIRECVTPSTCWQLITLTVSWPFSPLSYPCDACVPRSVSLHLWPAEKLFETTGGNHRADYNRDCERNDE